MSVAEMKIEVINKITTVENVDVLKEVLALLEGDIKEKEIILSRRYNDVKEQYGSVLQKLAQ